MDLKIHYMHASPSPQFEGSDALYNELSQISSNYTSKITSLYPFKRPTEWLPPKLYGLHIMKTLRQADQQFDLHHVFASSLTKMPVLRILKKPIIYSVVGGIPSSTARKYSGFDYLSSIVLSNPVDLETLKNCGLGNINLIETAINMKERISLMENSTPFRLILASSPWTKKQFTTKGILTILKFLKKVPDIHLILLWRNVLTNEMKSLIKEYHLDERITFVNERVDVSKYFANAHASLLLSSDRLNVKAYPHSLLESIFFYRPVLVSKLIPISQVIERYQCGVCIDEMNVSSLQEAVITLRKQYDKFVYGTQNFPSSYFCTSSMKQNFHDLYHRIASDSL